MIEVKNLVKKFNDKTVLDDISVRFEEGKTNMIIGLSGAGKTVFLRCIIGLIEPDGGQVLYDNRAFTDMNSKEKKAIRKEIGMVFQGGALFDSQTVEQNVIFPLSMFSSMLQDEKQDRANECLNRVNLENANHLYPSEISGGMRKRVAIARAIAMNPKYLFCDEPDSGLDPKTTIVIDNLIKEITEEFQMTTVINTHDMNSIMEIGDKIMFINKGKKWWEGGKDEFLKTDNEELNKFIFNSKFLNELRR